MLAVRFFASLRERLDCAALTLDWQPEWAYIADLHAALMARGPLWAEALDKPDLRCARNQQVADLQAPLEDGDEVAFFPPVTGG